jgi:hypothetical protein
MRSLRTAACYAALGALLLLGRGVVGEDGGVDAGVDAAPKGLHRLPHDVNLSDHKAGGQHSMRSLLQGDASINVGGAGIKIPPKMYGGEIRDFYFTGTEGIKRPMPHPEQPAKKSNLFMRRMLSGSDFTEQGVVTSEMYGSWDKTALHGLSTVNYIEDYWYTYIPGYGNMTDLQCLQLADLQPGYRCLTRTECDNAGRGRTPQSGFTRCDSFDKGMPNPDGLHVIKLDTGVQVPTPPIQVHIHAMEYDLISRTILALVTGYPLSAPAVTVEERPQRIMSLVAINETTGKIFDCTGDGAAAASDPACHPRAAAGQQSVTFCRTCPTSPMNLAADWTATITAPLPYDYTSVVGGAAATAFDTYGQTFYCILQNPREPGSSTLFGVTRLAIYSDEDATASPYSKARQGFTGYAELGARSGVFIVEIQWDHFFYYKFPEELMVMGLEFGPKRVVKPASGVGFEAIQEGAIYADEKTLFAHCTVKETGVCQTKRCGGRLTAEDVLNFQDLEGTTSRQVGEKCACTNAVIQLNVDADTTDVGKGSAAALTMGFAPGADANAETRSLGSNDRAALAGEFVVLAALDANTEGPQKYVPPEGTGRKLLTVEETRREAARRNVTGTGGARGDAASPAVMSLDAFRSRAFDYFVLETSGASPSAMMAELKRSRENELSAVKVMGAAAAAAADADAIAAATADADAAADANADANPTVANTNATAAVAAAAAATSGTGGRRLAQVASAASDASDPTSSARHPFNHIQYGVSSLLAGMSSATGDPRAGAYYFPAWENPSIQGKYPNKEGQHYLYEFGLKGQRGLGFWTPEGTERVPWEDVSNFPECYTEEFCALVTERRTASETDIALYRQAFEQVPFNCLCPTPERCNQCLKPSETGMQITRRAPTNAFTVFLHNTAQDSKAAEGRISAAQYDLPTVGTNSYPEQGTSMVQGVGTFVAVAGQSAAFTIQAINRFGYLQQSSTNDNFTVTISGPGFPALDPDRDCVATTCQADPVENPNDLPTYPIMLGPVWRDYGAPGDGLALPDPRSQVFPNVHDERYSTKERDPLTRAPPPTGGDAKCNTPGQPTDHTELVINRNKCVRRLTRPVWIAGTRGQYEVRFRVDRTGTYIVRLTSRGAEPVIDSNNKVNLGASLGRGLYQLVVAPGDPRAQFSTSNLELPEVASKVTIGVVGTFTIFSRDRFGNKATAGGSRISVAMTGPKYILCNYPFATVVDPVTELDVRAQPYNESLFVEGWVDAATSGFATDTIIEPTAAQRADSRLALYYTSYCMIRDRNDGTYTVEYYITMKNKGVTEYTVDVNLFNKASSLSVIKDSPFTTRVRQGVTDARKSFALNQQGEEFGTVKTVAGLVTTINVQARDRFGNLQNEGGDPFGANVTDALSQRATHVLLDTTAAAGSRRLTQVAGFEVPVVDITYLEEGIYVVQYQVFRAGLADLTVFLNGVGIGPPEDASNQGSPFLLTVASAATDPANSVAVAGLMQSLLNLTAGDRGTSVGAVGAGVPFTVQLRDMYNNDKEEAEDAYFVDPSNKMSVSQPTDEFPQTHFQYNIRTSGVTLTADALANVVTRISEGQEIVEEPINEFYSTATGMSPSQNVRYVGNGRFTTFWTTTLAGQYDIAVLIRPTNDRGEFSASTFDPICAEVPCVPNARGQATLSPYERPFNCKVFPAEFDLRMSELYYWDPLATNLGGARRNVAHFFYSSLNKLTHNFKMSDGRVVLPFDPKTFALSGVSGERSTFFFQARDAFANILKQSKISLRVSLTSESGDTYALENVPRFETPRWQATDGEGGAVEDLGEGIYQIAYMVQKTGLYALTITDDEGLVELRRLGTKNPDTLSTLGYSTWSFGDIFRVQVRPSATSSKFSSVSGDGLRGGVREKPLGIIIEAKDQLGNPKQDPFEDESALFALSITRCGATLPVTGCGTPLTAATWFAAGDTAFAQITQVIKSDIPGQYLVTWTPTGPPGFYHKVLVTYDRDGVGPAFPVVLGGRSSLIWSQEEIDLGAVQMEEPDTIYINAYADVYRFPRAPQAGQPVFHPIFAKSLEDAGAAAVPNCEVFHLVDGHSDAAFTGGVVGARQQFVIKVITGNRIAMTAPGQLAVIRATFTPVGDASPSVVVEQVLVNAAGTEGDCVVGPGLGNGDAFIADRGDGTYLVSLPADARDVTLTSQLLGVGYTPKVNTLTKAGAYTVVFEGTAAVSCRQPVTRMSGYAPGAVPYIGAVTMTPTTTNRRTSTLARTDGSAVSAAGFVEPAGVEVTLRLQARDQFDNLQVWTAFTGGEPFVGQLVRPSGGADPLLDAVTLDLRNGRYELTFTQTVASVYEFTTYLGGTGDAASVVTNLGAVSGGVFVPVVINPGPRHVPSCAATGAGFEAGTNDPVVNIQSVLFVQEADQYGNRRAAFTIVNGAVSIFTVTFTKTTTPQLGRQWTQTYAIAAGATPGVHGVVYRPGTEDGTTIPPLAGNFTVAIGVDGVGIRSSPFAVRFSPGRIDIAATQVSGPGIVFDFMNPGTVRAGIPSYFTIQARDAFGNNLVKSPEPPSADRGYFDVNIKPFGPDFDGKNAQGSVMDFGNGTYLAQYTATSNALMLLTVNNGLVPSSQFKYQPVLHGPIIPRPGEDPFTGTGGLPYPDQGRVFDYVAAEGEFQEEGVVVVILPGQLDPTLTQCADGTPEGRAVVGGGSCPGSCGTLEAGKIGGLDMRITARDGFFQPKNDKDADMELFAFLEYFANARDPETGAPLVRGPLNPKTRGYESLWELPDGSDNIAADGSWLCEAPNCMVLTQTMTPTGEGTAFYSIDPNLEAYITVSGFYRLSVKVRSYEVSILDGRVKREVHIGEGYDVNGVLRSTGTVKGDSPFEFYVLPATSDTGNSDLRVPTPPPPVATTAEQAFFMAKVTECNAASDASTVGVIAAAIATFRTCTLENRRDRTSCGAEEAATVSAAHPAIAAIRATCIAFGHPPPLTLLSVSTAAYFTAVNAFNAGTRTRCDAAQAASTTAANAKADATRTICNTENPASTPTCTAEWDNTKAAARAAVTSTRTVCLAGTTSSAGRRRLLTSPTPPTARHSARALPHDMSHSFTPETGTPGEAHHEDVDEGWEANSMIWTPVLGRQHDSARAGPGGRGETSTVARRSLLQTVPSVNASLVVAAGVPANLQIALKDGLGNSQAPNPLRLLDKVDVRLGESTCLSGTCPAGSGQPACQWQARDRLLPLLLPTPNCVPVFTQSKLVGGARDAPVYTTPPLLSDSSTPGLSLSVLNDFAAGTFTIAFNIDWQLPAAPAHFYLLEVMLNGKHMGGSPYTVMIAPGPVSGAMSELDARGYAAGTVDEDVIFGYNTRDRYGNARQDSAESGKIQVDLRIFKRSATGTGMTIRGCTSNAPDSGECGFEVTVTGEAAGKVTTGNYTVAFKTLTASGFGNNYDMRLRFCATAAYCDNRNNAYNAVAGQDALGRFLPIEVIVQPGATNAADCTAEGLDLLEGSLTNQIAQFTIVARDKHRNRRLIGGEIFEVLVYQPQGQGLLRKVTIRDLSDGTYQVSFLAEYGGLHSIIILLGPVPISNSPFSPEFRDLDGRLVPRRTRLVNGLGVELPQLPAVTAGEKINIDVRAYAELTTGFPKSKRTGGDTVFATVSGGGLSQSVVLAVTDGAEVGGSGGLYSVRADASGVLQRAGKYTLSIKACAGFCVKSVAVAIKGSPFVLVIAPSETVPQTSRALELTDFATQVNSGAGWRAGSTAPMQFRVQARDRFGNNQEYTYLRDNFNAFDVRIIGDRGARLTPVQTDDPASILPGQVTTGYDAFGVHTVSFRTNVAQNYTFEITLNGTPIANSPATVPVSPAEIDFENCVLQLNARGGLVGISHTAVLNARDRFGNHIKNGGHEFKMRMTSTDVFDEQGSGDNPLVTQVKVLLQSQTVVEDTFSRNGLFRYAFDAKQVESGITVTDLGTGMYIIGYVSQRAGNATLEVFLEQRVLGVNNVATVSKKVCVSAQARALCEQVATFDAAGDIRLTFDQLEPDPVETLVESATSSLQQVRAGEAATFTILPYDIFRNPLNVPGYTFTVALTNQQDQRRVLGTVAFDTRSNRYIGAYSVQFAGNYTMFVRRTGADLTGSLNGERVTTPFDPLVVTPGSTTGAQTVITHVNRTIADTPGAAPSPRFVAMAGETQVFGIATYDAFLNKRTAGGEKFVISLGLLDQGTFVDFGNGTYRGEYRLTVAGRYTLSVTVAEQPVQQPAGLYDAATQTFPLQVLAAAVDPSQCVAFGGGLRLAVAGEQSSFTIQARDKFQNRKIFGGDSFWAQFTQDGFVTTMNATDNVDGTYSVKYVLNASGYFAVKLSHPGQDGFFEQIIDRTVMLRNNPAPISLRSFASGPGLSTGADTCTVQVVQHFTIALKDRFLNNITVGESAGFAVSVATGSGPFYDFTRSQQDVFPLENVSPQLGDLTEYLAAFKYRLGRSVFYDVAYSTPTSGLYEVSVKYYGRHLAGSPYKVIVQAGVTADKKRCVAVMCTYIAGKGLKEGMVSPTADTIPVVSEASFTIYARDKFGNSAVAGGDTWVVLVTRPDGRRYGTANSGADSVAGVVSVTDTNDGTYVVRWAYNREGTHSITVSLDRDRTGALCGDVTDDGLVNEICHTEFSPANPSVLRVVAGALQPPSPASSFAYGDGVSAALAGVPSVIFVQSRKLRVQTRTFDQFNRSCITGGGVFKARALDVPTEAERGGGGEGTDPNNMTLASGFEFSVIDNNDGIYQIVYIARVTGQFFLEVTLDDEAIGVCDAALGCADADVRPFVRRRITVYPGLTSAATSTAEVAATAAPPAAGRKTSFAIVARDAVGNVQKARPFVLTPDPFEVYLVRDTKRLRSAEAKALTQSVQLAATATGYTVEYSPRISGVYTVHVELSGVAVNGTPFKQEIAAGAISPQFSTLRGIVPGQTLERAVNSAKALQWLNFTISAVDQYNNVLTVGGDATKMFVQVVRVQSKEEVTAVISDNGNGTYVASFMPSLTGTYTVLLVINGVKVLPIAGLAVTGQGIIRQVAVYAPFTKAEGAAVEKITAGVASFFEVQAYDEQVP